MINRRVLAKLLNLTTSSNDAEALAAMRKANAMVREGKITWGDVLGTDKTDRTPAGSRVQKASRQQTQEPITVPPEVTEFLGGVVEGLVYNLNRAARGLPPRRM